MDIRYYFDTIDTTDLQLDKILKDKSSLGCLISRNMSNFSSEKFNSYDVAIIGVPYEEKTPNIGTAKAPNEIRKYLYTLDNLDSKLRIIDLGNLKKGNGSKDVYFALRDVTDYLAESNIKCIVIGGGQDIGVGIARAFKEDAFFTLTTIDPSIDIKTHSSPFDSTNYISKILSENPGLFHINFLAYQSYYVTNKTISKINAKLFDFVRLGDLRSNMEEVEPIIRDSDFVSFDVGAIRQTDAPGHFNGSPNGLYSEEACKIARYAGLSNKLKVFGIFESNPDYDLRNQTSKLVAQIIWYFIEGFLHQKNNSLPNSADKITQFNVQLEELDKPIVFYQNKQTGQWWMQVNTSENASVSFSCLKKDYLMASKKEIPEKWLKFIRKIDRMSK